MKIKNSYRILINRNFIQYLTHILTCFLIILTVKPVLAEDFPFESGNSAVIKESEIQKGFSEAKGIQSEEKEKYLKDKLKVGGFLRQQYKDYQLESSETKDYFQSPSSLGIYLDAPFANDVRALFRGLMTTDTSYDSTQTQANSTMGALLGVTQKTTSQIEEMKIQFPIQQTVFATIGIQKVKWGVGKFWNPTDFLNSEKRDLLKTEDERSGLNLLKVHVPINKLNLYLIENFESASQAKSIGTALRGEYAFAFGEVSLTDYQRKNAPHWVGGDISVALGDIDFIFETARNDQQKSQSTVGGLSWDYQYSDKNFLTLTIEGVWNEGGVSSSADYQPLLLAQKFIPFQVAKAYQLASIYLSKPGSLTHSNFQYLMIRNQIDASIMNRLTYSFDGIQNLLLSFNYGVRTGNTSSEMKLGGLTSDYQAEMLINF